MERKKFLPRKKFELAAAAEATRLPTFRPSTNVKTTEQKAGRIRADQCSVSKGWMPFAWHFLSFIDPTTNNQTQVFFDLNCPQIFNLTLKPGFGWAWWVVKLELCLRCALLLLIYINISDYRPKKMKQDIAVEWIHHMRRVGGRYLRFWNGKMFR